VKLYALWKEIMPAKPAVAGRTVGNLLWRDEFYGATGSSINADYWTGRYCDQADENGGGTCHNNEPQWYLPSAVALDGSKAGNAVITTKRVYAAPAEGQCLAWSGCQFTSARFDTQGKVAFKYGYIETRIKMPAGGRNWPAFWMLGENITSVGWPQTGEIDIAEQGGNTPNRNSGALHYSTNGVANDCCGNHTYDYGSYNGANYSADFHTYAMAWTPNRIDLIVDGIVFKTFTSTSIRSQYWSFNNPFFLIINNATGDFGGNWTGWTQSQMTIDYVRVWKLDNQGEVFIR
jgi:beta-glucanase (GH16 family)